MSTINISHIVSTDKLIRDNLINHLVNKWFYKLVNGKPVKKNGNVWCPMCEIFHANSASCQEPSDD
jgi:hypothetical protein